MKPPVSALLFNPHSRVCCLAGVSETGFDGLLRQAVLHQEQGWRSLEHESGHKAGSRVPLFWQRAKKHSTAKSGFSLSLFPNVYLLCEFRQVSPWTCKTDFPAGLCILACIDLHSIKLQYLWFNFAKCCSDIVIWFWSKYSRHTHTFCLT